MFRVIYGLLDSWIGWIGGPDGNALGHVFVAGFGADASGIMHWIVRKN
jgi:hypothetical protein